MKLSKITIQRLQELSLDPNEKEEVRQDILRIIANDEVCFEDLNYFGTALKEIREEKGLTVEEAINLTGIDLNQWQQLELGELKPDTQTLVKITEGLELEPFELTNRALNKSRYFSS